MDFILYSPRLTGAKNHPKAKDLYFEKDKPALSGTVLKGFAGKPGEVRDLGAVKGTPFREE